jgi:hypothetical protein
MPLPCMSEMSWWHACSSKPARVGLAKSIETSWPDQLTRNCTY